MSIDVKKINNGYCFILHGNNTLRVFGPFSSTTDAMNAAISSFKLVVPAIIQLRAIAKAHGMSDKAFRPKIGELFPVSNPRNTPIQERINFVSVATLENHLRFGRN